MKWPIYNYKACDKLLSDLMGLTRIETFSQLVPTVGATQRRVTDARILVASKVEKSTTVVSIQENAIVDHSFNNICGKNQESI